MHYSEYMPNPNIDKKITETINMNICYVCNEYPDGPHGGVGTMTQLLAEELNKRNHSVKVIGVYDKSYPSPLFEIKNGVEIFRVKVNIKNSFSSFYGYYKVSKKIKQWIKNEQIDIIESPDSYGLFSLFSTFKKPFVLRAHGNNTYFGAILGNHVSNKTKQYEKHLYRKAFAVCAVSEFTANKMKALMDYNNKIDIIYNGIDLQSINGVTNSLVNSNQSYCNIVFSGTLIKKKGIYELVNAIILLLKKGHDIKISINGKDTINPVTGKRVKEELQNLIPTEYIECFDFKGHVTRRELFEQFKTCKIAVFPSYSEAFAMAPLESMACGTPTVYSSSCSGEELIENKVDGILIDPTSELSIANGIEFLLCNPDEALKIGNRGRAKIENLFSKETMTLNTLNYYERITTTFYNIGGR